MWSLFYGNVFSSYSSLLILLNHMRETKQSVKYRILINSEAMWCLFYGKGLVLIYHFQSH